ncbi:hypothetical protein B6N13_03155 [Marinomonas sp. UCMA 3892]|uniref:hypothetical protein n=1 Tax=Marinomonas sp. UCMA 3892 TaxID=1972585 RepID=UPI00146EE757|nr:hypothetical protein [Marinomonas sp. UCMA 3892]NLU97093.1 hypothetical protein [Marinomonas sp. UCMA 3892]
MESILKKKHYRNVFYGLVGLLFFISVILRYLVLPQFDNSLEASFLKFLALVLDGFSISLLVSVLIGGFVFWVTPDIVKKSVMDVIDPKEIGPLLKKATSDSRTWIYKGACGRYTRSTTLPMMAKSARQEGIGRDIRIILLDPSNDLLCDEYATYRRSLKSAKNGSLWTKSKVKEEVVATVISALRYKHEEPLLRIEIYLVNHFSAFRFDISDQYVIVTKEDSEAAGLKADKSTYFYDSYIDDSRLSERQSKRVSYNKKIPLDGDLNTSNIKDLAIEIGVVNEIDCEELDLEYVVKCVNVPEDPYS